MPFATTGSCFLGDGTAFASNGGEGTLRVEEGGFVGTFNLEVGQGVAGVGRVAIDGAGSRIVTASTYGGYLQAFRGSGGSTNFG